jgi:hypothetical protein
MHNGSVCDKYKALIYQYTYTNTKHLDGMYILQRIGDTFEGNQKDFFFGMTENVSTQREIAEEVKLKLTEIMILYFSQQLTDFAIAAISCEDAPPFSENTPH